MSMQVFMIEPLYLFVSALFSLLLLLSIFLHGPHTHSTILHLNPSHQYHINIQPNPPTTMVKQPTQQRPKKSLFRLRSNHNKWKQNPKAGQIQNQQEQSKWQQTELRRKESPKSFGIHTWLGRPIEEATKMITQRWRNGHKRRRKAHEGQ